MGIRVLLLFKEDWLYVHEYLLDRYAAMLMEEPFVHIRKGDDDALYKGKIKIKDTKPYRSAHYLLRTEKGLGIEIQVRTLYEEAWSEIDHKLRYPYNLSNNVLANYIGIMNRITGIGDEMGSFVNSYIRNAGLFIHNLAETFYDKNKLAGKVYFDDNIFENCLIDILVDIARLKYFHDISYVNYIKFIAYTAS